MHTKLTLVFASEIERLIGRLFHLEVVATLHGSLEGEVRYHHVTSDIQNLTLLNYLNMQDQEDIMMLLC